MRIHLYKNFRIYMALELSVKSIIRSLHKISTDNIGFNPIGQSHFKRQPEGWFWSIQSIF